MGYIDFSDAELRALTRQRRAELAERRRAAQPPTIRVSAQGDEFTPSIWCCWSAPVRRKAAYKAWRIRQWREGNRNCFYCETKLMMPPRKQPPGWKAPPNMATLDHREPLSRDGDDAAWNWVMCCWDCNNKKGKMTEAAFRAWLTFYASPVPQPPSGFPPQTSPVPLGAAAAAQ